ncbi:DUF5819 family protein [Streptomyces sp. NPDC048057]|uniref:DUF5819 family protein n=1 Tax=Streptomyces sp. NPDC048057 TaxID=3155628 RepID=UPI0033F29F2E
MAHDVKDVQHVQGAHDGEADPGPTSEPAPAPDAPPAPTAGIAALTLPYQIAAAVALGLLALAACIHLAMTFLHVAPSNTVTKEYGKQIDAWIYPEFEQNWKLFAPNPLQQNIGVQVKAEVKTAGGELRTTEWIDLAAEDADAIRGNLLPSHTEQNMLRRSWDFYQNTHDSQNRSTESRGPLAENYLRRLVMLRLADRDLGGQVERIQIRSSAAFVKPPPWTDEKVDTAPVHRVLPWWTVTPADLPPDARNDAATGDRTRGTEGAEGAR